MKNLLLPTALLLLTVSITAQIDVTNGKIGIGMTDAAHDVQFRADEILFQDKSGINLAMYIGPDGKVGIGTVSPSDILEVKNPNNSTGGIKISSPFVGNNTRAMLTLSAHGATSSIFQTGHLYSGIPSWSDRLIIGTNSDVSNGILLRSVGGGIQMTSTPSLNNPDFFLNSDGNLGIGKNNPTSKLDVAGKTKTTQLQVTTGAASGKVLQSDADGNATWVEPTTLAVTNDNMGNHTASQNVKLNGKWLSGDGGNEGIAISNDGKVGIGTTSPESTLDLGSGSAGRALSFAKYVHFGAEYSNANAVISRMVKPRFGSGGLQYSYTGNVAPSALSLTNSGDLQFSAQPKTSYTEGGSFDAIANTKFIVKNNGRVGIGTINPASLLNVVDADNPSFRIHRGTKKMVYLGDTGSQNAGFLHLYNNSGTETTRIGGNTSNNWLLNNVGIGTTSPTTKLDVAGKTKTTQLQVTTGAADGKVLQSDATGNATWVNTSTLATNNLFTSDGELSSVRTINTNGHFIQFKEAANIAASGAIKADHFGYGSGSYKYFSIGNGNNPIGFNVDLASNSSGSFSGNGLEFGFPNGANFFTPNAANNGYHRYTLSLKDGNVGIGTSTPLAKLHVANGNSSIGLFGPNSSWGGYLKVGAGSDSRPSAAYAQVLSTNGNLHLDSGPSRSTYINHYSKTSTFINPQGGNVGIGNTSPSQKLHVSGNIKASDRLYADGRYLHLGKNILNGDNSSALNYISGHSTVSNFTIRDEQSKRYGALYGDGDGAQFGLLDGDGNWSYLAAKDNYTAFRINDSEKLRLASSGAIKFTGYTGTNHNGTPTSILGVDASGNVVKTNASDVGKNIYNSDGTLESQRKVSLNGNNVIFEGTGSSSNKGTLIVSKPGSSSGSVSLTSPWGNPGIVLRSNNQYRADIQRTTTGLGFGTHASSAGPGASNLFLKDDGNVAIGTTNPFGKLHIRNSNDGADQYSGLRFYPATSATSGSNSYHRIAGFRKNGLMLSGSTNGSAHSKTNLFLTDSGFSVGMSNGYSNPEQNKIMTLLNNGKVGIGKTNPSNKLNIQNNTTFHPHNASSAILTEGHYGGGILMKDGSKYGGLYMIDHGTKMKINMKSNASTNKDIITLKDNGYVGLGVHNPYHLLDLGNSLGKKLAMYQNTQGGDFYGFGISPSTLEFHAGSTLSASADMVLKSGSGNVGIGTTNPIYRMHTKGDIYADGGWFRVSGSAGLYFQSYGGGFYMTDPTWIRTYGNKNFYHNTGIMRTDGILQVGPNGNRLIANSNGRVGINTTNPGATLHVNGSLAYAGRTYLYSDKKLKKNISNFNYGLKEVLKLNPINFTYKKSIVGDDDKQTVGLIAQELQKAAPNLVSTFEHPQLDTTLKSTKAEEYLAIEESAIKYMLINAIKEQQKQIDALKSNINNDLHPETDPTPASDQVNEFKKEIDKQAQEIETLKILVEALLEEKVSGLDRIEVALENSIELESPYISQNIPNPTSNDAIIKYYVPENAISAQINFFSLSGQSLKSVDIDQMGQGELKVDLDRMMSGSYLYNLTVDGQLIDTKTMIIIK